MKIDYEKQLNEFRHREEKWNKVEKKALNTEIEKLQKQQFILKMKALGHVIV
jgi:hypothetical protein